eukprot:gnl/MRDRNA2_/MRDRNA2_69155_c0_seq1.p1 gnl/MRDRNA2_/MRDRNA2_69155_c0~~gnl/MRDRNA2_/MRDRNA2_69155_c0_seq1.p1  ORF type:complete len:267 (+),score=33.18 gnl/MRDRNA2_/MRDRNA2_69155_c0_seq1:119-919(+)
MQGTSFIMLLSFIVLAHALVPALALEGTDVLNTKRSMDELVNKLIDTLFDQMLMVQPVQHMDLENAALAKSPNHFAFRSRSSHLILPRALPSFPRPGVPSYSTGTAMTSRQLFHGSYGTMRTDHLIPKSDQSEQESPSVNFGPCRCVELSAEELEVELIDDSSPVILDAFATWCGPCQIMKPIMDQVAERLGERVRCFRFNTEKYDDMASRFRINGLPTILFLKPEDDVLIEVDRYEGAAPDIYILQLAEHHFFGGEAPPPPPLGA